jgi:hypothetical protein
MTKNIDKKKYEKPSMKVYPLPGSHRLLVGSLPLGAPNKPTPYQW